MNYKEIFEEFTDLVCYDQDEYIIHEKYDLDLEEKECKLTIIHFYKKEFIFYEFNSNDKTGKFVLNHNFNNIQSYIENNFSEDDKNKLKKLKTLHLINEF